MNHFACMLVCDEVSVYVCVFFSFVLGGCVVCMFVCTCVFVHTTHDVCLWKSQWIRRSCKITPPPLQYTKSHTYTQAIEKIEFQVLFSLATIAMFHLHISIILPATGN